MADGRTRIFEARYFGLIIGLVVFGLLALLSFQLSVIENIEENVFLDVYFNWKLTFTSETVQEVVTFKARIELFCLSWQAGHIWYYQDNPPVG